MAHSTALYAFYLVLHFVGTRSTGEQRDVATQGGVVRGAVKDEGYVAYLGVPYAAPPITKNRFKAPLPPLSWNGVYEANRTVKCPQYGIGEEDCLVLNIFTPDKTLNKSLPVLVYFHGGSFLLGVGQSKGVEPLIKQNIIVVTVNYRLGALGFLCLGIKEAAGNAGLKDQVAALKWVQNNIANFGGDPKQVTIFGMSAGGASVEYHVLSKMSKGLFQRAIVESASATAVWTVDPEPIVTAMEMADALDFPKTNDLHDLLDYYLNVSADKLSAVNYDYYNNLTDGYFGFVPCVEKELPSIEPFITESPYEILTKEKYDKIPMMYFFATIEGLYARSEEYYKADYKNRMETNFLDFVPGDLVLDNADAKEQIADIIKHYYFGNKTVSDNNVLQYLNYFGDYLIMNGLLNSVEIQSRSDNPVYLLEFAYKGNMGSYEKFYENITLAGHGDVVKHAILEKPIQSSKDKVTVDRVSMLIANFVKYGNPTPRRSPLLPVRWPQVKPHKVKYLYLNEIFEIHENPQWERKLFWDQLYHRFRKNIKAVDPERWNK